MNLAMLRQHRDRILALSEQNGISNIRIFGSVARGDAQEGSDVDMLVTVAPGISWEFAGFKLEMETLLNTRVDIVSDRGLNAYMREHVLQEAIPL